MSDSLKNLPDGFLFQLVPPLVANLDTRGLLEAVVGGLQDRVADLRSYVARYPDLIDPDPAPFKVVLVQYQTQPGGNTVPVTLEVDSSTPDDDSKLVAWAADQLEIDVSRVVSAIAGTDALREIGVDTLQLLAQSIGAVLYPGLPGEDPDAVSKRQRQTLSSYFPRLRLKGTTQSFSIFARLAGFDEGSMIPLWTRLSPRAPGDLGILDNDADFRARADIEPTGNLPDPTEIYDPLDFTDGPFYAWSSGTLSKDPISPDFYLTAVNGRNPFIRLTTDNLKVDHPSTGVYTLVGGASGRSASTSLSSGTTVSHLEALALTDGEAFNGLRITVTGTGSYRTMGVEAQLSTLKYRSSDFDLALFKSDAGTRAVTVNPDLAANPALVYDGIATAPFRPWSGGTNVSSDVTLWPNRIVVTSGVVRKRVQATGTMVELDSESLIGDAQRVYGLVSQVKAATRFPRHTAVGVIVRDKFQLAAFPCVSALVVTAGTGSYGGIVPSIYRPSGSYKAAFSVEAPPAISLALTTQIVSAGTFKFSGPGLSGSFFRDTGLWQANVVAGFTTGTLTGHWSDPDPTIVRTEPSNSAKSAGTVCYTHIPEGTVFDSNWNLGTWDDVPWLRPLLAGGEDINSDLFLAFNDPAPIVQDTQESRVKDISGVYNKAIVYDLKDVLEPPFVRLIPEKLGAPVTIAMAGSGTSLYPVVGVSPGAIVAEATWNRDRYDNAILWWPLSEQPFQHLAPIPALGLGPDVALIRPTDRGWDDERGWCLRMADGGTISRSDVYLPDQYSFAVTAKMLAPIGNPPGPIVTVGAAQVHLSGTQVWLSVRGESGLTSPIGTVMPAGNAVVYVSVGTGTSSMGVGNNLGWNSPVSVIVKPKRGWTGVQLSTGFAPTQLHDFMVWDGLRTTKQLDALRSPTLVPTHIPIQRPYISSISGDRWSLRVLPSAFVVADRADAKPEVYPMGEVRRYAGTGRFIGNPAYKQVGLGGSQTIPDLFRLGLVGPAIPAIGKVVVSGTNGEPGNNISWSGTTGTLYEVTPPYGSTGGNTIIKAILPGSNIEWPPELAQYNSVYDRFYLKGDTGFAYEVKIDDLGDGNGPVFVASIPLRPRPERELNFITPSLRGGREVVTDFESDLETQAYDLAVNSSSIVYPFPKSTSGFIATEGGAYLITESGWKLILEGGFKTSLLYIYLNSRIKSWATDAYTRWVNPNEFGQARGIAALDSIGELIFENTDLLTAGNYRLSIDAGNLGTVDNQFDGFYIDVLLTTGVGNIISFPVVLLPSGSGTDPRGWTKVEFKLPYTVSGPWRLSLRWTNDRDVPSRGQFRRLAVYSYTLRKIASELHKISLNPLAITPVDVTALPLAAGAYVASYNSFGTIISYDHEQNIYALTQGHDDFNNPLSPLADTLTGSTLERRDSINVGTYCVPPDPIVLPGPVAGSLSVSPIKPYYNVGDVIDLLNNGSTGVAPLRRTWQLWSSGTLSTFENKLPGININYGGTLPINVDVIDDLGRSSRASTSIIVNNPPSIQLAAASLSFAPVPYDTKLSAIIADNDGDSFNVSWYRHVTDGSEYRIGVGTPIDYTVTETQQVRVYAIDTRGGTNFADVPLTGGINGAPTVSFVAMMPKTLKAFPKSLTGTIPPPQKLQIAAMAKDPENRGITPLWTFWDGTTIPGSATLMKAFGGGTFCSVERIFAGQANEVGTRLFSLAVTDGDGLVSTINGEIELLENMAPVVTKLTVSSVGVKAGEPIYYSAAAYDPDGDEIDYVWEFPSLNLVLFGPDVVIDTTGLAGHSLGGSLKVSDAFGGITERKDVPNATVYAAGLSPISFSPAGGITSQGVVITIESPDFPDAAIMVRYTLDGSDPTTPNDGFEYRGPVMIPYVSGTSVPVSARAFKYGAAPSILASATFIFP